MRIERQQTLDVTRVYSDVTLDDVIVSDDALFASGDAAQTEIARSSHVNAVLACAELTGVGKKLLEMTLEYAAQRVQFGRPVGSYQAVKHKCADIRMWVQSATAATYYAAMAIDAQTSDHARAVSVAKVCASDAITRVAGEALQLHGGVGFTWEHDLHLNLRRARTNALLYGDATHHRELLLQFVCPQPADNDQLRQYVTSDARPSSASVHGTSERYGTVAPDKARRASSR